MKLLSTYNPEVQVMIKSEGFSGKIFFIYNKNTKS
jgi:hypothetical protein